MNTEEKEELKSFNAFALNQLNYTSWPLIPKFLLEDEAFARELIELEIHLIEGAEITDLRSIESLPDEIKDNKTFFMDLLKDLPNSIYGYNLAFLSSRLRDDEDIVEAFLSNVCDDNSATPFISDRLKSDKKFIFRMVSSGYSIKITHISAELRRDREFILSISEFIGLYQIPKKLRKDKGILLKSSKCDIIYVKYLPEELRKDYAFIYKSFKCYNKNY